MLAAFEDYVKKNSLFSRHDKLLLALSGGEDSICLFHLLLLNHFSFSVAHCNFQLRGADSEADEAFVRQLAETHKITFYCKRFDTREAMELSGRGVQVTARKLRYDWFGELMQSEGIDKLLTAHHMGDNSETMLINLLRSTGISGLHGIPVTQKNIARPLMFTNRENIHSFIHENKLEFRLDKSNLSDDYLRNRIRHHMVPMIREIEPEIDQVLMTVSSQVLEFEQLAQELMDKEWGRIAVLTGQGIELPFTALEDIVNLHAFLYYKLRDFGFNKSQIVSVARFEDVLPGKRVEAGNWQLSRERDCFLLSEKTMEPGEREFQIESDHTVDEFSGYIFEMMHGIEIASVPKKGKLMLDISGSLFPLTVRSWVDGDRMQPMGMSGSKKISDILTDKKAAHHNRKQQLVLTDSTGKILALLPDTISDTCKIGTRADKVLSIYSKTP